MDLTTQPVLCCIGRSVAEYPTQFVMQRLFSANELDWKVLTVEVASEDFDDAMRGMQAMNFAAVRVYGDYECRALDVLERNGNVRSSGPTSSLQHQSGKWDAWHSLGFGLLDAVGKSMNWSSACCILTQDSLQTQSLLAAMSDDKQPCRLLLMAQELQESANSMGNLQSEKGQSEKGQSEEGASDWPVVHCLSELGQDSESSVFELIGDGPILIVGDVSPELQRFLQNVLQHAEGTVKIMWAQGLEDSSSANLVLGDNVETLTRLDQLAFAEAYDFTRWTGLPVEVAHVKDACEEFFEF